MVLFFTGIVKVTTCCKAISYRLSSQIFPLISFNLDFTLAIVTEIVFMACFYLLKRFFNFETVVLHQVDISVSQIAMKKRVIKECHCFRIDKFFGFV